MIELTPQLSDPMLILRPVVSSLVSSLLDSFCLHPLITHRCANVARIGMKLPPRKERVF